jgi:hypothetical protein
VEIKILGVNPDPTEIEKKIHESINIKSPILGLKAKTDSLKKKILISHTQPDISLAQVIYNLLIFNNVPAEEILYTSSENEKSRIPENKSVPDYLKEFFVDSYSTQRIYVLFVTSECLEEDAWWEKMEIGASWITQVEHKIFNIPPFRPKKPLNDELQWHNTRREKIGSTDLWMYKTDADIFCQKIEDVCEKLNFNKKARLYNRRYLSTLVNVIEENSDG